MIVNYSPLFNCCQTIFNCFLELNNNKNNNETKRTCVYISADILIGRLYTSDIFRIIDSPKLHFWIWMCLHCKSANQSLICFQIQTNFSPISTGSKVTHFTQARSLTASISAWAGHSQSLQSVVERVRQGWEEKKEQNTWFVIYNLF